MLPALSRAFAHPLGPRLALAAVLAGVLAYSASAPSVELFGRIHFDDAVLFSSAKALAQGQGFIVPNLPEAPPQTKYPVLYPWLLSLIWRWNPAFPENVAAAVWLSAALSCTFLALSFQYLRRQPGVSDWAAWGCIALTAANAQFLDLSSSLMSEALFMALAAATLLVAESNLARKGAGGMAAVGILAGLTFLARTAGLAFLVGVAAVCLWRRDLRKAVVFSASAAPFLAGHFFWTSATAGPVDPDAGPGWVRLWAYVTSYPEFWKLSVPTSEVLWAMVNANFTALLQAPAALALFTPPGASFLSHLAVIALSLGIVSGLIRQGRRTGWSPSHVALALTACLCIVWNFPIVERLLLVFTPLFGLGAWVEARHIARMMSSALRSSQPALDKAVVAAFGAAALCAAGATAWAHATAPFRLRSTVAAMSATLSEQDEAARWVVANAASGDVLLAYAESRFFLETGRPASWPAVFTTDILFDGEASLERQFDDYLDAARHLRARYWIVTDSEMASNTEIGARRLAELQARFPVVFRSSTGAVRIHDLMQPVTPASRVAQPAESDAPSPQAQSGSPPRS